MVAKNTPRKADEDAKIHRLVILFYFILVSSFTIFFIIVPRNIGSDNEDAKIFSLNVDDKEISRILWERGKSVSEPMKQ